METLHKNPSKLINLKFPADLKQTFTKSHPPRDPFSPLSWQAYRAKGSVIAQVRIVLRRSQVRNKIKRKFQQWEERTVDGIPDVHLTRAICFVQLSSSPGWMVPVVLAVVAAVLSGESKPLLIPPPGPQVQDKVPRSRIVRRRVRCLRSFIEEAAESKLFIAATQTPLSSPASVSARFRAPWLGFKQSPVPGSPIGRYHGQRLSLDLLIMPLHLVALNCF